MTATLRASIQRECDGMSAKEQQQFQVAVFDPMMDATALDLVKMIQDQSNNIDEATRNELLSKCEANLSSLLASQGQHRALLQTLGTFSTELDGDEPDPHGVLESFMASFQKRAAACPSSYDGEPKMRELRRLCGTSGAECDDDDDDVMMTQESRTFKCPVLQVHMEPTGDLRPVYSTTCQGKCLFSFAGIHGLLKKGKPIVCPTAGCANKSLKAKDLAEAKETVKELKRLQEEA